MEKRQLDAVLIDDEVNSLNLLEKLLSLHENIRVTGTESDPDKAVGLIISAKPDIVFLDVKMPGSDGFDVLDKVYKTGLQIPYIVFTTAFDEFALRAFEYAAFDYLLKPVDPERLSRTIERCYNARSNGYAQKTRELLGLQGKLIYKNSTGVLIIDPSDIACVEADGNYCIIKFRNGKTEVVTSQLGKIEEQLPSDKFYRISRAFIINVTLLKRIVSKKRECLLQSDETEFRCEISQGNIKELLALLNKKA